VVVEVDRQWTGARSGRGAPAGRSRRRSCRRRRAALKAATSGAARLGLDAEIGTVELGKRADLVLVDSDPLADLRRLAAPRLVMQAGFVVSRA